MDEMSLEGALNELVKQFGEAATGGPDPVQPTGLAGNPRADKVTDLARRAQASRKELQKSIDTMQEMLDYLRICIKYQAFDLEATRRENAYLRKLLEENGQ